MVKTPPFHGVNVGSNPAGVTIFFGRLAQLGERLPYKQDVSGSSPLSPTRLQHIRKDVLFCFICRQDEPLRGTAETGQKSMQCSLVYNITGFRHRRGPATGDALHRNHWLWCQIQGGGKRRSGATSIDDNAVDDSIAGEADRRSSPAAGPYTHLRVAELLQMRFTA